MTGRDKGKTGKVLAVDPRNLRATVEGRNLLVRHERPKKQGQKGQKIQVPYAMHISKLALVCPHCGKVGRLKRIVGSKGMKVRVCRDCGKEIA